MFNYCRITLYYVIGTGSVFSLSEILVNTYLRQNFNLTVHITVNTNSCKNNFS